MSPGNIAETELHFMYWLGWKWKNNFTDQPRKLMIWTEGDKDSFLR